MDSLYCVAKQRIEWIDTAKCICIILVILGHVFQFFGTSNLINDIFSTFRMPLYFILSGLFFKQYGGAISNKKNQ